MGQKVNSRSIIAFSAPIPEGRYLVDFYACDRRFGISNSERYEDLFPTGIPVRVVDIDASVDEMDALQIEVEENPQR